MFERNKKLLLVALLSITVSISLVFLSVLDSFADTDRDGIPNSFDNYPRIMNPSQSDFDGDKLGSPCDADDDNDGFSDKIDELDQNPSEHADFDKDGKGSNAET